MQFQGTNGQVAFVAWDNTNNEWRFNQRPIVDENGTLFDYKSCSSKIELEQYEYDGYNWSMSQSKTNIFKPALPEQKFTLKVWFVLFIDTLKPLKVL